MGLIQSVESLKRKVCSVLRKKEFCLQTVFRLKMATSTLPWVSSLLACPGDFGLASPHDLMLPFLKFSVCLSTSYWFWFPREPWLICWARARCAGQEFPHTAQMKINRTHLCKLLPISLLAISFLHLQLLLFKSGPASDKTYLHLLTEGFYFSRWFSASVWCH